MCKFIDSPIYCFITHQLIQLIPRQSSTAGAPGSGATHGQRAVLWWMVLGGWTECISRCFIQNCCWDWEMEKI